MSESVRENPTASRTVVVWLAVLSALTLVVLLGVAYLFVRPVNTSASGALVSGTPVIMSASEVAAFGREHAPVYWAGPKANSSYEVTWNSNTSTVIRYLPTGVNAGTSGNYLTVATYSVLEGYDLLTGAGAENGSTLVKAKSGARIVTKANEPTRAYFSFPGASFQVEVYSPSNGAALKLVDNGSIALVK